MAAELAAEIEAHEAMLKAEMQRRGVEALDGLDYRITWRVVQSSRFDTKAFRATHGSLYSAYLNTTSSRRFTIS